MKVYLAINEWASEDACGTVIKVFEDYERAKKEVNEWIEEEKRECWDTAFDESGELIDGYSIDQGNDFWEMWEDDYYVSNHTKITIEPKEVM